MFDSTERSLEIIEKFKEGKKYRELAREYNTSITTIWHIVNKNKKFRDYCNEMEDLKARNEVNEQTKLYDLSKMLKFDTRSINALMNKNIKSIDKLLSLTEEDISSLRKVGKLSKSHITKCINDYKEKMYQQVNLDEVDNKNTEELVKSIDSEESISKPVVSMKASRDYIWKLIKAVDNRQIDLRFLQKEISREFDRIENINKELLKTLINLQKTRNMPWIDEKRWQKVEMEYRLEEILNMYE